MEITKFRSQLSIVLEQGKVHLWHVRSKFRKLTRIAARRTRRLGRELRTRKNVLPERMAGSRDAMIGADSKIAKAKTRLSIAFGKATAHLRQAQNRLGGLTRSIAEKPQKLAEKLCAREDELRAWSAARSRAATVAAKSKITKVKAQVSSAFRRGAARLRQTQDRLARLKSSVAEKRLKLAEERRARKDELRVQLGKSQEAIIGAKKIAKTKAPPPAAPELWTAHLLEARNPLAGLARSIAEKPSKPAEERHAQELPTPPEEVRARGNEWRVPEPRPREAIVEADTGSAKVKAQISVAFKQGAARIRQARKTLGGVGKNIVDKRQKGRQELGARESEMRELLANSPDAIAVIDGDHCLITANRRALDLFGVSERNLSKFNIEAFLFRGHIRDLHQNGSFFMGRREKHGKCTIRRLDGSLRVAEFAFVADFLPLQHLCRFYDLCMPRPTPIQHRIGPGTQHFSDAGQAQ